MTLPKAYWLLWAGQTLSRVGLLAPAFLVLYLEGEKLADDGMISIIVGLFGAGVVAAGLIGGVLADMIGPRRTIMLAQPVAIVTSLLFLVVSDRYSISALSLLAGFLSMVDRPAGAGMIAEIVPAEGYSRAYSIFLVGFNVGMALGPVLAGVLLDFYPPGIFILWTGCSVIYTVLAWALPADNPRSSERGDDTPALRRVARGIVEPFRTPVMLAFLICTFFLACIYIQVNSTLPLDMRGEGLSPAEIGIVLAINAILMVVMLPFIPRLVKGMRDETPLVLASILIAAGFGLNALAHNLPWFVIALVVWTSGEMLFAPMSATFLAKRAPEGRTSTYQGSFFFAWNAAFVVGGPLGVTVAQAYGYDTLWIGTLILGIAVAIGYKLTPRLPGNTVSIERVEARDTEPLGEK